MSLGGNKSSEKGINFFTSLHTAFETNGIALCEPFERMQVWAILALT